MARRFIMEVMPNKAPQNAYILQPTGKGTHRKQNDLTAAAAATTTAGYEFI